MSMWAQCRSWQSLSWAAVARRADEETVLHQNECTAVTVRCEVRCVCVVTVLEGKGGPRADHRTGRWEGAPCHCYQRMQDQRKHA